jgi:hypothetical protein
MAPNHTQTDAGTLPAATPPNVETPARRVNHAVGEWLIDTWDDEEGVYDGEWDDLLRSGK